MRPIPIGTVFSRADARAQGWSDAAVSRAVRSGRLLRIRHDQFTAPEHRGDLRVTATAAARACRGSVVSHRSAAMIHGLPLLRPAPARPDLTITPQATGDVTAALLHRATLLPQDVVDVAGTPVTTVARTLVDMARSTSTAAAVVTADAALHRDLVDLDTLQQIVHRCQQWPGIRRAKRVLAAVDGRAESPLESFSRLVLQWLHLPVPDLQMTLCDEQGSFLGRVDFYWDEFGVAGEADGRAKYGDRDVLTAEKRRQEKLEDLGVVLVRWGWSDVDYRPHHLGDHIARAFERGQRRDLSGFPRRWSVRRA